MKKGLRPRLGLKNDDLQASQNYKTNRIRALVFKAFLAFWRLESSP
jgi:hypothetical protein